MGKHAIYLLLLAFSALIIMMGCNRDTSETQVSLEQEFSLAAGQSAEILNENLKIRFLEVIEDSRCPQNVVCIWAGRVSAVVEISSASQPVYRMVLTQPGLTGDFSRETYGRYEIAFNVKPYPEAGKQIAADEYNMQLSVSKK